MRPPHSQSAKCEMVLHYKVIYFIYCASDVPEASTLRNLAPCLGAWGPWFGCILLGGGLGPQKRRAVLSSRHFLIERKAKSNAGGLVVLLID
jgi:hypothetical protein